MIINNIKPEYIFIYKNNLKQSYIQYKLPYIHLTSIAIKLDNITIKLNDNYFYIYINNRHNINTLQTIDNYMNNLYTNYIPLLYENNNIYYLKFRNNSITRTKIKSYIKGNSIYIELVKIYKNSYKSNIIVYII